MTREIIAIVCVLQHDTIALSQNMFLTDQKWTILLLKILEDMNAPDQAFESVLKRAQSSRWCTIANQKYSARNIIA